MSKYQQHKKIKMVFMTFDNDSRVATLSTLYLTFSGITKLSLKLIV